MPLSTFKLCDASGHPAVREVCEQDFIRIDIPGPGPKVGNGYDWVNVKIVRDEMIAEGDLFSIQVKPSPHPLEPTGPIAHFLDSDASSTFQIRRIATTVYAEEHARNESPNLKTGNKLDNLRNGIVGTAASLGLSYPQWKSLVNGLVERRLVLSHMTVAHQLFCDECFRRSGCIFYWVLPVTEKWPDICKYLTN